MIEKNDKNIKDTMAISIPTWLNLWRKKMRQVMMMTTLMIMNHDGVDNHEDNYNDMDGDVYPRLATDDNDDDIAQYDEDVTTRPMMKT